MPCDQPAAGKAQIEQAEELRLRQAARPLLQLGPHAPRGRRADQRAHGTPRDQVGRDTHLVQHGQHAQMRPTPRPARAKRQSNLRFLRHRCPLVATPCPSSFPKYAKHGNRRSHGFYRRTWHLDGTRARAGQLKVELP